LGSEYFAQDIIEPLPAVGEDSYDANANRDVTPERFLKLEKELVRGKAEVVSFFSPRKDIVYCFCRTLADIPII